MIAMLNSMEPKMSSYPPGVTGFEYEIAGPDFETEEDLECVVCDTGNIQTVEHYHGQSWFFCGACGAQNDVTPDLDAEPDLYIDPNDL